MENVTARQTQNETVLLPSIAGTFPLPLKISYAIIGTVGIFGNGLVLVVFARHRFLKTITNLFIVNQSVADLLASVLLILNNLTPPISYPNDNAVSSADFLICAFWSARYFFWVCQKASTFNLVVITIERYVAVVFPLKYRRRIKWKTSVALLVLTWIASFAFQSCWLAIQNVVDGRCVFVWPNRATQIAYGIAVFLFVFIIPIVIMAWVYTSIYKVLRARVAAKQKETNNPPPAASNDADRLRPVQNAWVTAAARTRDAQNGGQQEIGQRVVHQNYRDMAQSDVIRTLLIVGSIYTICWTPNMLLFLYISLGGQVDYRSWYYHTTVCLAFTNVAVNPFIYTLKYSKFRRGLVKTFGASCCAVKNRIEPRSNNIRSKNTTGTLSTNVNSSSNTLPAR